MYPFFTGQILERVPKTRLISEPTSFSGACNLYLRGKVSLVEYEQILESTFRLQCKADTNTDNIVLKISASATAAIPFLMAGL